MKFGIRQVGVVCGAIALGLVMTSCKTGKVAQCADMIQVINQTVIDTKTNTESGTTLNVGIVEKLVTVFDKAAKDMNSVNVSDEKLKTYKSQFLSMYQGGMEINKQLMVRCMKGCENLIIFLVPNEIWRLDSLNIAKHLRNKA
jgi:hypothetical protein